MQQPMALPNLRWRPEAVSGTPIFREIFDFAAEIPTARFKENERPGIPFLRAITTPLKMFNFYLPDFFANFIFHSRITLQTEFFTSLQSFPIVSMLCTPKMLMKSLSTSGLHVNLPQKLYLIASNRIV